MLPPPSPHVLSPLPLPPQPSNFRPTPRRDPNPGPIPRDTLRAQAFYEAAILGGSEPALNGLAVLLEVGYADEGGVPRDAARAKRLYERAIGLSSDIAATVNLAVLLEHGAVDERRRVVTVQKDPQKARLLYERAAIAGNECAMCRLGDGYEKGCKDMELKRDVVTAVKWYVKAVRETGSRVAMERLGVLAPSVLDEVVVVEGEEKEWIWRGRRRRRRRIWTGTRTRTATGRVVEGSGRRDRHGLDPTRCANDASRKWQWDWDWDWECECESECEAECESETEAETEERAQNVEIGGGSAGSENGIIIINDDDDKRNSGRPDAVAFAKVVVSAGAT